MAQIPARSLGEAGPLVSEVGLGGNNFGRRLDLDHRVARERGVTPFVAVQNQYSLLVREAERDVLGACERLGLGFVPFFPLASGLLTGKYRRGEPGPRSARLSGRERIGTDEQFEILDRLSGYARDRGVSLTNVAIGALLSRPVISSVIAGATTPEQVSENVAAAQWKPSVEDLDALDQVLVTPGARLAFAPGEG